MFVLVIICCSTDSLASGPVCFSDRRAPPVHPGKLSHTSVPCMNASDSKKKTHAGTPSLSKFWFPTPLLVQEHLVLHLQTSHREKKKITSGVINGSLQWSVPSAVMENLERQTFVEWEMMRRCLLSYTMDCQRIPRQISSMWTLQPCVLISHCFNNTPRLASLRMVMSLNHMYWSSRNKTKITATVPPGQLVKRAKVMDYIPLILLKIC